MAVAPSSLADALQGRYTLEHELGRGGMATVYLAQDLKHHRPVAIKVLHAELAHALGPGRFLHEIQVVARLQHPHILPLHDSGEASGLLYYVMPYVAGESLRSRLTREKQLPLEHAVQVTIQMASALAYAHEQGVVHRDIKPENILLEGDQAVLADFGIARAISIAGGERLTETGLALGTPAYMSPEQGAGERHLDARSDIYSLGCVVYEMLAGEPPFTGPTAQAIIAKRFAGSVPRIRVVREEIPEAVDHAIARALAKAPADRFAGASQFARALTSALQPVALSQTSEATADALAQRWLSHRWISRRVTKLALGAALVTLAGVGGALWMRRTPPPVLDPNLVAVAPFDVFDSKLALWQEGLVDVLSANLDGAGPLRTVSPTVVVRRWRGRADWSSAMDLGRRTGASLAVFGQLMGVAGDSVRLRATLLDVARGRAVGEFEQRAPSASMDRLTDSLTVALFRELGRSKPIGVVRFAGLGSTSLPALKAFLQGEQFYRRSAWDSAVAHYGRAIALDSTFALALYHQSKALKWGAHVGDSPERSLAAGLQAGALNRGLAPRESLLIAADSFWSVIWSDMLLSDHEIDTVAWATFRGRLFTTLEEGTRRYPDDPEIWFELGDAQFHLGWRQDMTAQQPLATLDKAIALDSAFAPSYLHAADLASYLGDAARLRRYVAGSSDLSPLGEGSFGLIGRLLDPNRAESAETENALKTASVDALGEAWGLLQTLRDSAEVGLRVARLLAAREGISASLAGDSVVRRRSLAATLAYRGHLREAYQHVGREDSGFFFSLFGELALLGGIPRDTAAALFSRWLQRKPFWPAEGFNGLVTALPWWSTRGDTLSLLAFMHRADSAIQSSTYVKVMDPGDPRYAAASARAYLAVARGDTAEAVRRLAAMPLRWCGYCWLERLTHARLLVATGRHGEAFALLDPGFPQRYAQPIRPVWTLELARVAEQLGERAKAIESYRFITEVWRNADPELQPYVAEAHAALRRYAGEESR